MTTELLKSLTGDQKSDLLHEMKEWVKDCQWGEKYEEEEVDAMTDEELLRGIAAHYQGSIDQFIKDTILI